QIGNAANLRSSLSDERTRYQGGIFVLLLVYADTKRRQARSKRARLSTLGVGEGPPGRARVRAGPAVFPSALLGYSCGEVVTDRGAGAHCVAPGLEGGRHCGLDLSGRLGGPPVSPHAGGRQPRAAGG